MVKRSPDFIGEYEHPDVGQYQVAVYLSHRKSLKLLVTSECRVELWMPPYFSLDAARTYLATNQPWIVRGLNKYRSMALRHPILPLEQRRHLLFLGEDFTFRWHPVETSPSAYPKNLCQHECNRAEKTFHLHCPSEQILPCITGLIDGYAHRLLPEIIRPVIQKFVQRNGIAPSAIKFRLKTAQWGSCSSSRIISLNTRLVQASPECICMIMVHELCHLVEMNHSKRFYALMDEEMPGWRAADKWLKAKFPSLRPDTILF